MKHIHKSLEEKKEECIRLLRSTNRPHIDDLISFISHMGYFVAPGSYTHHRFKGGLVSHSLETYYEAMALREQKIKEGFSSESMPEESVIISALMHDLCKADTIRYNDEQRKVCRVKKARGHSRRSVCKVGEAKFRLTEDEKNAILWHMGGRHIYEDKQKRIEFFQNNPLSDIIRKADGSSIGKSKKRHHKSIV